MRTWSKYQQDVFDNIATGTGNTVVRAVAGSGKTTTIVEALKHVPRGCSTLFVAFNKSIADELQKQAPQGIEVSTLHSYGLKTITRSLERLRINKNRVYNLMDSMQLEVAGFVAAIKAGEKDKDIGYEMRRDLEKTVSLAKGALSGEESHIDEIIDTFDIESPKRPRIGGVVLDEHQLAALRAAFIRDVLTLLVRSSDTSDGEINFDDMIWLPVVLELRQPTFDRVFVDETQDLNPAQIEMTLRAVKPNGRICAVGDPRQAIYGFRGADSAAVDNVVRRLEATVLPLSVCYRCCKSVIRTAKEVVPEIEWAPEVIEGSVTNATVAEMKANVRPGEFILSRTNAPLISLCMYFLKNGRPATIQGRDIGTSLAAFVKKSAANSVVELCEYIEKWRDTECKRLAAKRRDTQAVEDRAECILALSDGAKTVMDVVNTIERLFADDDNAKRIVLSSTHKAKGMERDTVWMLASTYRRRPEIEEENLYYVAVTRARKELYVVHGEIGKKEKK